jgi:hypothetical protein
MSIRTLPGDLPSPGHLHAISALRSSADSGRSSSWPLPQTKASTLPGVEPFTGELLPESLRGYVVDIADRQQSPPDFAAVTALCGLAAVLGNKVCIRPKQHDNWEVVPTQ